MPDEAAPRPDPAAEPGREVRPGARLVRVVSRRLNRIGLNREHRLLLWAALTGMALAVIALAFIRPIQWIEHSGVGWLKDHPSRAAVAIAIVPVTTPTPSRGTGADAP